MTKLDEIFEKYSPDIMMDIQDFKVATLEFAKHILKEAADNAKVDKSVNFGWEKVDKKSITDTLNKYL